MARSTLESARTLFSRASSQGGYFTAKQAREVGYGYPHLEYHVSTGTFERIDHGLYRLVQIGRGEHDELIRWTLWSRNRQDQPQAIVSHETALLLHGLSELMPTKLDFTVPSSFRKATPPGCIFHKRFLDTKDYEEREGFRVTTPQRTLMDIAQSDTSREQVAKAVRDAVASGLIRRVEGKAILKTQANPAS
jgi:predicted transcriptional regulator of viral defense system